MSRVPMGKVLLRNVIRHTDAHNKIQEESEMWKLRDMEKQSSSSQASKPRWMTSSHLSRSSMHCDRDMDDSEGSARDRLGEKGGLSERDEREARYWSRKLYEFEANDPDRWGHSGFKELYPEEFQSDGETGRTKPSRKKNTKEKMSADKRKNSKKSSKRKKKKKKRTAGSDSESDSSESDSVKRKQKRKSGKSKHSRKKKHKRKTKEEESSTDDSNSDRRGEITRRKRRRTAADSQKEPDRKKRKNWKANEEKSEESSED
ncbi:hypothetical protein AMEX_G21821 [Astyanax mexicanus]|uniref:NKAP domain containing 1 n=2 Tax=Astyanax mexicanus TaxID=7994 RepID=A0A8B9HCF6_ASTMX|nr:hypothetical protein AMEX_G21821 [Astyanax mexicanus]